MKTILKKIIEKKRLEVQRAKIKIPLAELKKRIGDAKIRTRNFRKKLSSHGKIKCIGELKIASPSLGYINKNLDLAATAKVYEKEGIDAISVLTDRHFKGRLQDLKTVRNAVSLPILRKDFIIDTYQIYESLYAGADAVLLIAAILSKKKLREMIKTVHDLKLDALIEIHNQDDLKKVPFDQAKMIGINNRNLRDFSVDLTITQKLVSRIPKGKIIVSESGIKTRSDVLFLSSLKIDAMLIGEGIASAKNITGKIRKLLGKT